MVEEEILSNVISGAFGAGIFAILLGLGMFIFFIIAAFYIYHAWARYTIAKKLKHQYPWLAWIPFAGTALRLQLGRFHWAWTFLWLIPILGWIPLCVLGIISDWRIFERRNYPAWLSLVPIIAVIPKIGGLAGVAYLIIIGFVAWKDN